MAFVGAGRHREGVPVTDYDTDYADDTYMGPRAEHTVITSADGQIAAAIAVAPVAGKKDVADLRKMSVAPQFEHNGLGTALTKLAIEQARLLGYRSMQLETSFQGMETARGIYEKAGFKRCGPDIGQPVHSPTSVFYCMDL